MKVSPRKPPQAYLGHQKLYGYSILLLTWLIVVLGTYGIFSEPTPPQNYSQYEAKTGWPVRAYYVYIVILFPTIIWLWALLAWIGMKFFRNG